MSEPQSTYRQMWADLGLDLERHDILLAALSQLYQETFLTQQGRPQGMAYFDFVMRELHGQRIQELLAAKRAGRKVIGSYCVFVPEELILAVDGVSVGLCAGADWAAGQVEQLLPSNTCALIRSFFGFALDKVCPYLQACDMVVGENTCDGKKKSYEHFTSLVRDLYVMDLPQQKSEKGKELLTAQYRRFAAALEGLSGKQLSLNGLRTAIQTVNAKRQALQRLARLRAADPAPISGLDTLLVNQVFFYDDPVRFTNSVTAIADELELRVQKKVGAFPAGAPRILISGCPMAVPNWKLPKIVEGAGAVIVGEESCTGERGTRHLTGEDGNTVEQLIDNIVDRYFEIDCAIFTPNSSRLEHIQQMARDLRADGVIHYALQFCTPYQMESGLVERALEKAGLPTLRLDTDYGTEDTEQLRTRVEAFIARIGA